MGTFPVWGDDHKTIKNDRIMRLSGDNNLGVRGRPQSRKNILQTPAGCIILNRNNKELALSYWVRGWLQTADKARY
ncbi:hypothetical protein HL670_04806 [Serratia plymuthica]|nr:hypothetical protein HL670_04806 [Serratia plymuthica]